MKNESNKKLLFINELQHDKMLVVIKCSNKIKHYHKVDNKFSHLGLFFYIKSKP